MMLHQLRKITEIGDDRDFHTVRAETVADRIGCLINREWIDPDVANLKRFASANVLNAFHFLEWPLGYIFRISAMRGFSEIGGTIPPARELREGAGMVGMFVGTSRDCRPR